MKKEKYLIKLPRDVVVDIFNLPENFKEIVEKTFSEYTEGTAKDYQFCDKLCFIDVLMRNINNCEDSYEDSYEAVNKLVEEKFSYEWRENGNLITEDDIYSTDFMERCYVAGIDSARLYSQYGLTNHHIYEQIQRVIVKVITIIMNYEGWKVYAKTRNIDRRQSWKK